MREDFDLLEKKVIKVLRILERKPKVVDEEEMKALKEENRILKRKIKDVKGRVEKMLKRIEKIEKGD
jgi:uncharacterized membrane protein (DUF106 family)